MKTSVFFNKINNWDDFNNALILLNNKEKGDEFELLTKLYFLIDHKYDNYDNIWLLSEVPKKELEIIGLESRKEWYEYCKNGNKPNDIPRGAKKIYINYWKGWADFLGKEK